MTLKICGDLLKFLDQFLLNKTKFNMIKINSKIRNLCMYHYLKPIMGFVNLKDYQKCTHSIQKCINKLIISPTDSEVPNHITHLFLYNELKNYGSTTPYAIKSYPPNLKYLKLDDDFYQSLQELPQSLLCLKFDVNSEFNQPLPKLSNLMYLKLGYNFSQPLEHVIPSLHRLVIYKNYLDSSNNISQIFFVNSNNI